MGPGMKFKPSFRETLLRQTHKVKCRALTLPEAPEILLARALETLINFLVKF